jgi:hypothetical protein
MLGALKKPSPQYRWGALKYRARDYLYHKRYSKYRGNLEALSTLSETLQVRKIYSTPTYGTLNRYTHELKTNALYLDAAPIISRYTLHTHTHYTHTHILCTLHYTHYTHDTLHTRHTTLRTLHARHTRHTHTTHTTHTRRTHDTHYAHYAHYTHDAHYSHCRASGQKCFTASTFEEWPHASGGASAARPSLVPC